MADFLLPSISGALSQLHRRQGTGMPGNTDVNCPSGASVNTSLQNCQKMNEILVRCNTISKEDKLKQDLIDCFCTQELLNAYVG
jgi:hypothetical protein